MQLISFFTEILKFKSITPDDDGLLEFIASNFDDFSVKFIPKNGVKNLLMQKQFSPSKNHICFAGHVDVVPPGDGWKSDPFIPVLRDDFIYARGAQDMKSGVAAFLCAIRNANNFDGKISIILTSDEEGDGIYGTQEVLKFMEQNGDLPDFAIVAEPTCDRVIGDSIKVGRRGSINGVLNIFGKQGHAAYPQKCINPAHILAKVFDKFADFDLCNGDEFFEPSKIVITDIRGGIEVCNVTPDALRVMFNVRNSNKIDIDYVENYIKSLFNGSNIDLKLTSSSKPFLTCCSSKIIDKMVQSIQKITNVVPNKNTKGGTSDARYFSQFGVDVVEFGVVNDRIHAVNERVRIIEVQKTYEIFKYLIENFGD